MLNIQYRVKQLVLLGGDVGLFLFATIIAIMVRHGFVFRATDIGQALYWFAYLIPLWIIVLYINGTYDIGKHRTFSSLTLRIIQTLFINASIGVLFFYIFQTHTFSPKTILLLTLGIGYLFILCWRMVFAMFFATRTFTSHILFVGHTPEMEELAHIMKEKPERGYILSAWITDESRRLKEMFPDTTFYSSTSTIRPSVSVHHINDVIIASDVKQDESVRHELYELLFWQVNIRSLTALYESLTGRIPPYTFSETWFLDHLQHSVHPMYERTHRLMDIVCGSVLFLIFLILFPFIALAIKLTSPGPILFRQERMGLSGIPFSLIKFRSMYALAEDGSAETAGVEFATKDDVRITRVGRLLRKARLDELPQTINLLKGDISLIGPRPERPNIVRSLESQMPYYPIRHIIKPGITGWAQVNQHYTDTLEQSLQKLQYDVYYIKNRSILLDLSILLKTVNVIVRGMGQ
jgi:exopolysaccharide biosynthesis polyprenyl glycosylphosphotransferase